MNKKRKLIIVLAVAILIVVAVSAFLPVFDVNVIFAHPLDNDELATVFQDTSFRSVQYFSVRDWGLGGAGGGFASNSLLFGTPLEGEALEEALSTEPPRCTGFAILAGQVSFIDMVRIERSPFVYDVAVYFPYLQLRNIGARRVTPHNQLRFYEMRDNR